MHGCGSRLPQSALQHVHCRLTLLSLQRGCSTEVMRYEVTAPTAATAFSSAWLNACQLPSSRHMRCAVSLTRWHYAQLTVAIAGQNIAVKVLLHSSKARLYMGTAGERVLNRF